MTVNRSAGATGARRFDAFDLAARGDSLAGEIDVSRRARVADRLAPAAASAPIAWQVAGAHDALDRPLLRLTIEGRLPLLCQRCLQPFEAPIEQRSELLLARTDAELERLDAEALEVVLAAGPLDAMTMVEDEILLSLPFAPRHPEGQCPADATTAPGPVPAQPVEAMTSPFARLAALKKGDR